MKVLMITEIYPFPGGEEFIETEIGFWLNTDYDLTVANINASQLPSRAHSENIKVVDIFSKRFGIFDGWALIRALFSLVLLKELLILLKLRRMHYKNIIVIVKDVFGLYISYYRLKIYLKKNQTDVIYSYWNHRQCYAAALLKKEKLFKTLVSRCHRFDIYEEQRAGGYIPLKRQFVKLVDLLLTISTQQISYACKVYGFKRDNVQLARLGVSNDNTLTQTSTENDLKILSVSYIRSVKRMDLIHSFVYQLSKKNIHKSITWTHIGGNAEKFYELYPKLRNIELPTNLKIDFLGHKTNLEVKKYYKEHLVDLFVNLSESEGVPVSIMEAMSFGVPVLATDVGSTNEVLHPSYCKLVTGDNIVDQCVCFSVENCDELKNHHNRSQIRKHLFENYDAEKNYTTTINLIHNAYRT